MGRQSGWQVALQGNEMSNNQGERMYYVSGHGEQKPPSSGCSNVENFGSKVEKC